MISFNLYTHNVIIKLFETDPTTKVVTVLTIYEKTFKSSSSPRLNFTIGKIKEYVNSIRSGLVKGLLKLLDEGSKDLEISNSVEKGQYSGEKSISTVHFNSSDDLIEVGDYAFENCVNLTEVNGIERSVFKLGTNIFKNCTSLPKLNIGELLLQSAISKFKDYISLEELLGLAANEYMLEQGNPVCLELELPNVTKNTHESYNKSLKKRRFLYYLKSHIND